MKKMAKNHEFKEDEEYIDMELIPYSPSPSSKNREFEFQIQNSLTSSNDEKETNISTFPAAAADELFYNGKLLPLNMTKLTFQDHNNSFNYFYPTMPLTAPCTNTVNTPIDSSPSESCRASCELNPDDDYFFEWSTELKSFINNRPASNTTKKYSKKLKLIKKLKASRAYLVSLFTKSPCSDHETTTKTTSKAHEVTLSNKYLSITTTKKKQQLANVNIGRGAPAYPTIASIIKNLDKECVINDVDNNSTRSNISHNVVSVPRRSFSSAIKRHSPTKCLSSSTSSNSSSTSSSFSVNSNSANEMSQMLLRRSSSATETEVSIEAAIAHCKKCNKFDDVL